MAFTVYGLLTTNATAGGPYWTGGDVVAITGANPAAGANLFAYFDQNLVGRQFYSSNANGPSGAVSLPTLATPNFIPAGFVQLGTSAIYVQPAQAFIPDPSGGNQFAAAQAGALFFAVQYQQGSPEAGSPVNFTVDPTTVFLIAAAAAEFP